MSFMDRRFARDHAHRTTADIRQELAEDRADAIQDKLNREADAEFNKPTQLELDRQAREAYEWSQDSKAFPIGTTLEQARQRGWVK